MKLQLTRPIVFLDLETTGLAMTRDRIVQITAVKIHPDGRREEKTRLVNPEMPIPADATAIHGISDDDVRDAPSFRRLARGFAAFLENADLAGYNISRFDIPMLLREFERCGITFDVRACHVVDAQKIFFAREPRTLAAALKFYCDDEHLGSHDAKADVEATIRVVDGQLARYDDLPDTPAALHAMFNPVDPRFVDWEGRLRWRDGEAVIGFGQKSGTTLRELAETNRSYLEWILRGDFNAEVKQIVRDALGGVFPQRRKTM